MQELFGKPSFNLFSDAIESGRVTPGSRPLLAPTPMPNIPSPIINQTDYENSMVKPSPIIQGFLESAKMDETLLSKRSAVIQMIENNEDKGFIEDAILNKMQWKPPVVETPQAPQPEKGFLDKITYESIKDPTMTEYAKNTAGGAWNVLPGLANLGIGVIGGTAKDMYMGIGNMVGAVSDEEQKSYKAEMNKKTGELLSGIVSMYGPGSKYADVVMRQDPTKLVEAIREDPVAIITDAVGLMSAGAYGASKVSAVQKAALEAQKAETIAKIGQTTDLTQKSALVREGIEKGKLIAEKGKQVKKLEDMASTINKYNPYIAVPVVAAKTVGAVGGAVAGAGEYVTKLATGLDTETQRAIKNSPELYKQAKAGEMTGQSVADEVSAGIKRRKEELSGTGKEYDNIKKGTEVVDIPPTLVSDILESKGLKLQNGKIITGPESVPLSTGDIAELEAFIRQYGSETKLTGNGFLNTRKALSNLANYGESKTDMAGNIARELRAKYDDIGKKGFKTLAETDAKYAPEVKFLDKVTKDIFNRDGTVKDNVVSIIRNLNGKGKEAKVSRLEQIIPGITEKVKAIKAYEDVLAATEGKVGGYARGVLLGGGGAIAGGLPGAIIAFIVTNPTVAAFVLEKYGIAKSAAKNIIRKATGGLVLTKPEQNAVKQAFNASNKQVVTSAIVNGTIPKATSPKVTPPKPQPKVTKPTVLPKNPINGSIFDLSDKRGSFKVGVGDTGKVIKKPDALIEEARKYGSAEEFISKQPLFYHGTYAQKQIDYKKVRDFMEKIYEENGAKYPADKKIFEVVNDAQEILQNLGRLKNKNDSLVANLASELSKRIEKPSVNFAGTSNKDVIDNKLGAFLTPEKSFAGRFTYDVDVHPYTGRKTFIDKRGYIVENYFKGEKLDLYKLSKNDAGKISTILNKDLDFILEKSKTKEGTKQLQKLLYNKRNELIDSGYDAIENFAYELGDKKYYKELVVLNDSTLYTKKELTEIYNQANKK